jgi:DNA-binding HxlR family transcriptional regulator
MAMSEKGVLNHPFRKGELLDLNCPSREILQLIALDRETLRFSELRKKISGISEKMLSQTLQTFEKDGFIHRTMLPVMPPHTEYRLTPLGLEVYEQVIHLSDWIELNLPRVLNAGKEA